MAALIGLSGSLRKGSLNTALLSAAAGLLPPGSTLDAQTIHDIPLYDADVTPMSRPLPACLQPSRH